MRKFFEIMKKDILSEHYTDSELLVYGILTPIVLFAVMAVAGWLETSF